VVDIHHKPHRLTSLSRCHVRCIRFNTNQDRNSVGDSNLFGAKGLRVCCLWRTGQCPVHQARTQTNQPLSGIQWACSAIIHRTVQCALDMSGEPPEQRLLRVNGRLQKCTVMNSARQKSEVTGHVRCGTGLSSAATGQGFQQSTSSKPQWVR
jgi:hypothetical protein